MPAQPKNPDPIYAPRAFMEWWDIVRAKLVRNPKISKFEVARQSWIAFDLSKKNHPGRYVSPQELDQVEDLLDKNIRPSLATCIAMAMEIRDARGWARLDGAEKKKPSTQIPTKGGN